MASVSGRYLASHPAALMMPASDRFRFPRFDAANPGLADGNPGNPFGS